MSSVLRGQLQEACGGIKISITARAIPSLSPGSRRASQNCARPSPRGLGRWNVIYTRIATSYLPVGIGFKENPEALVIFLTIAGSGPNKRAAASHFAITCSSKAQLANSVRKNLTKFANYDRRRSYRPCLRTRPDLSLRSDAHNKTADRRLHTLSGDAKIPQIFGGRNSRRQRRPS